MSNNQVERLEKLKSRHKALEQKKIETEAELRQLDSNRAELEKEMKETFGVDTLDALREKYDSLREEEEKKIGAFEDEVAAVEKALAQQKEDS